MLIIHGTEEYTLLKKVANAEILKAGMKRFGDEPAEDAAWLAADSDESGTSLEKHA